MEVIKGANLALRFLLKLCTLGALVYFGSKTGNGGGDLGRRKPARPRRPEQVHQQLPGCVQDALPEVRGVVKRQWEASAALHSAPYPPKCLEEVF